MLCCIRNFRSLVVYLSHSVSNHGYNFNAVKRFSSHSKGEDEISVGGLANALGKFRELEKSEFKETKPVEEQKSFMHLLRHSEFVQMGDPTDKIVIGKIFQVVNTDLYIDFGGKFYCVCRRPRRNSELYVRNARVKLRINETELCARFLGATEDLTLTEASGTLLDLVWTPVNSKHEATKSTNA